jgi:hypothetical protein
MPPKSMNPVAVVKKAAATVEFVKSRRQLTWKKKLYKMTEVNR